MKLPHTWAFAAALCLVTLFAPFAVAFAALLVSFGFAVAAGGHLDIVVLAGLVVD